MTPNEDKKRSTIRIYFKATSNLLHSGHYRKNNFWRKAAIQGTVLVGDLKHTPIPLPELSWYYVLTTVNSKMIWMCDTNKITQAYDNYTCTWAITQYIQASLHVVSHTMQSIFRLLDARTLFNVIGRRYVLSYWFTYVENTSIPPSTSATEHTVQYLDYLHVYGTNKDL